MVHLSAFAGGTIDAATLVKARWRSFIYEGVSMENICVCSILSPIEPSYTFALKVQRNVVPRCR
jgi:hypothetical protein